MNHELTALTSAALLQCAQYALMAVPVNLEVGTAKTLSARDANGTDNSIEAQLSQKTARLVRALNNHFEGLLMFAIAVVVVTLTENATGMTAVCAWAYVIARILYIPAYAYAWVPWRSVFWFVGFFATVIMLVASLV